MALAQIGVTINVHGLNVFGIIISAGVSIVIVDVQIHVRLEMENVIKGAIQQDVAMMEGIVTALQDAHLICLEMVYVILIAIILNVHMIMENATAHLGVLQQC